MERSAQQPVLASFDRFHKTRLRRKLGSGDEANRCFVRVLAAVSSNRLDAVEAAIREALDAGAAGDE